MATTGVRLFIGALALTLVACSGMDNLPSPDAAPADVATAGMCGADIPPGQACNALVDDAAPIIPTCVTGPMPVGTGGTIVAGTYAHTAQTYYNVMLCPTGAVSGTIVIGEGCIQSASRTPVIGSGSASIVVRGNMAEVTVNCVDIGPRSGTPDAPIQTFTATATTLTFFTMNANTSSPNPDRVEVFTRQ